MYPHELDEVGLVLLALLSVVIVACWVAARYVLPAYCRWVDRRNIRTRFRSITKDWS